MALTNGHHLYAALHEDAINKFIRAYRNFRPKYFYYACPPLGSGMPGVDFWVIPALPIPGTFTGMPISIRILDARIDFTPAQSGLQLPTPLVLGPNQFALTGEVEVCFLCGWLVSLPPTQGEREHNMPNPEEQHRPPRQGRVRPHLECAKLSIWAVGHPLASANAKGGRDIALSVDRIVVKDVGALEPLIECYAETMVNGLLDAMRLPLERFALGALGALALVEGPVIADNQAKVWADII